MTTLNHNVICRNFIVKIKKLPIVHQNVNIAENFQSSTGLCDTTNHTCKNNNLDISQFGPTRNFTPLKLNTVDNIKGKENLPLLSHKTLRIGTSHIVDNELSINFEKNATNLPSNKENMQPTIRSKKRKRHWVNVDVYEFSSENSTKNADPAEDIIKKLIKNDKVTVATNYKRKAQLNIKNTNVQSNTKCDNLQHKTDFHSETNYVAVKKCTPKDLMHVTDKKRIPAFSQNKRAKKLLTIVRKIISTPKEKHTPGNNHFHSSISSIATSSLNLNKVTEEELQLHFVENLQNSRNIDTHNDSPINEWSLNIEKITPLNQINSITNIQCGIQNRKSSRAPLKAINILEVIHIPAWNVETIVEQYSKTESITDTRIQELSPPSNENQNARASINNKLFGFEEYIINSIEDDPENRKIFEVLQRNGKTLPEKLKELRKWKPRITMTKRSQANTLENRRNKTNNIKEILCSTMIKQKPSKAVYPSKFNGFKYVKNDSNDLFEDPVLKKDQKWLKTYDKLNRKCFKAGRNNFTNMQEKFVNVRSTDQVENYVEIGRIEKPNEYQKNSELEEFAKYFNKVCNEVQQYKLIIEKSDT